MTQGFVARNGTYRLVVATVAGEQEIRPRQAMEANDPSWRHNVTVYGLAVAARPCEPPRTYSNAEGNDCLLRFCDPGFEVRNTAVRGSCVGCAPGTFSNGIFCESCPWNVSVPEERTYCASTACEACEACDDGFTPERADSRVALSLRLAF